MRDRLQQNLLIFTKQSFTNARLWPFSAPGALNLNVRCVPEAEVRPGVLNGSYRESSRSDLAWQLPLSALTGHLLLTRPIRKHLS